jgi:hypothetical protein
MKWAKLDIIGPILILAIIAWVVGYIAWTFITFEPKAPEGTRSYIQFPGMR